MASASPKLDLSVIVPVGPGDEAWRELLPLLSGLPEATEFIISACEPAPKDWQKFIGRSPIAEIQWLVSAPGRAQQLNQGIELSRGRMLWLLHADSHPSQSVIDTLATGVQLHDDWRYFDLAYDKKLSWLMGLNAMGANLRSRLFKLPFGDQGWLISRTSFYRVGEFDTTWHRGEDLEWAVRARRHQIQPMRTQKKLTTSSRRYLEQGWLKTTLTHAFQTVWMIRKARRQHKHCR